METPTDSPTSTSSPNQTPDPAAPPTRRYPVTEADVARVVESFTYHSPRPDQIPRYEILRTEARSLAYEILGLVPPGRERSLAITHLETAIMWANKGIACGELTP